MIGFRRVEVRSRLAAALLALALAGCGGAGAAPQDNPYAGLPPCTDVPAAVASEAVQGLVLPGDASIQSSMVSGPLTTVNAYVAATPREVRDELTQRSDVEVLHSEDEVFEAELLVNNAGRRSLVKAVAVCDAASRILAVISDGDGAGLPAPGGS